MKKMQGNMTDTQKIAVISADKNLEMDGARRCFLRLTPDVPESVIGYIRELAEISVGKSTSLVD